LRYFKAVKIDVYGRKDLWKSLLLAAAALVGAGTLWYTESFLKRLRAEEATKLELWAEAIHAVNSAPPEADLNLAFEVIKSNTSIPVILTDSLGQIITHSNLDERKSQDSLWLRAQLKEMASKREPIPIPYADGGVNYMHYRDSTHLLRLRQYPLILLGVIALLVGVAYLAFGSARRAEQDRVWTGMAKETAHQIGTPLSSLLGWIHLLREQQADRQIVSEMEQDAERLNRIAERFSKIGSHPELSVQPIESLIERVLDYLRTRSPGKIEITYKAEAGSEFWLASINAPLFEWVVENMIRNSVDALEGRGLIELELSKNSDHYRLLVRDNGKGMTSALARKVFRPGFTTKQRGWGLGLSLSKRIVEEYHGGKMWVIQSEPGRGTTMGLRLPCV